MGGTGPVRQKFDIDALQNYIEKNVQEIQLPIEVKQFGYGQSNPSYQIKAKDGKKYVMRKKPPGELLSKTAHRVDREYRIIHALENTDVPVPRTLCFCDDDKIIGTIFYIMDFLDGRIFEDPAIPEVSAEDRNAMWKDAIRTLAKFHSVSPKSVNLESFGKHGGFYDRQLKLFKTLSQDQGNTKDVDTNEPVGQIPYYDDIVGFFQQESTQPKDRATFIHGDYKIDNLVFHKTEPRVIGILDWEMATIGHPLSDLCNLLFPYVTANNPTAQKDLQENAGSATTHDGFRPGNTDGLPTHEQCLEWYAQESGWRPSASEITWGDAFMAYKSAIIMQGIGARHAQRQASSENAAENGKKMKPLGKVALDLVKACQKENEKAKL